MKSLLLLLAIITSSMLILSCLPAPDQNKFSETQSKTEPTVSHATPAASYWIPAVSSSFQIQLTNYPPDIDYDVDIFELDLFETPIETIQMLHGRGKKVICYFNAGAWEIYRPDAEQFSQEVIGKPYIGWPNEKWLDVSRYRDFAHIIEARLDLAIEKGCNGVDPDNMNGYTHPTGFEISAQDQLNYNIWLSEQAHQRGLSIGLKNNSTQVSDLINHFDFAVIEDCTFFSECDHYLPFIKQGKAVFQIEYTDRFATIHSVCDQIVNTGFFLILKNRNLDAFVKFCP